MCAEHLIFVGTRNLLNTTGLSRVILYITVTFPNMSKLILDEILSKGTGVQDDGLRKLAGVAVIATDLKS